MRLGPESGEKGLAFQKKKKETKQNRTKQYKTQEANDQRPDCILVDQVLH